ncbi:MAG: CapA family protein [Desulfobacteraceae bacterium]|nr:CapA family protein [Desulfobacteraceae bacterium]MBC2719185.1 CapA family protein [Desulfobacteraceae bacterium]
MPSNSENSIIALNVVGDVCFGLGVRGSIVKYGNEFPFEKVVDELLYSNILFGNLEVVFPGNSARLAKRNADIWAHDNATESLSNAQFDIMSIANNHIMDFGIDGLENTLKLLNQNNIKYTGAGKNIDYALKPVVIDHERISIGFVAFADNEGQRAGRFSSGTAEATSKLVVDSVTSLKKNVDIIVVSLHMGIEFTPYPSPFQVKLSRKIADAGADVIIGHHPHVLQGIEVYKGSLICYSLGNFVFQVYGDDYQQQAYPYSTWGAIIKINMSKNGYASHEIIPSVIKQDHRPWLACGKERKQILQHIEEISKPLKNISEVENLYRTTCRKFAITNLGWFEADFQMGGFPAVLQRCLMMINRAPNRRWIGGFARGLISKVSECV